MDTYGLMRQFADSWGLLGMLVFFVVAVAWTLRPGSKRTAEEAARIPFNDDHPET